MQAVKTEVLRRFPTNPTDPFAVYRRVVSQFGCEHAFLAESAAGPEVDCQRSYIALQRVASARFRTDGVEVEGRSEAARRFMQAMESVTGGRRFSREGRLDCDAGDTWPMLRALLRRTYRTQANAGLMECAFVVRLEYDAASRIERIEHGMPRVNGTVIRVDLFQHLIVFEPGAVTMNINHCDDFEAADVNVLVSLFDELEPMASVVPLEHEVQFTSTRGRYIESCQEALEHIKAGDIYQVQLGHQIQVRSPMKPQALYARLRESNPSPYMFLYQSEEGDLVGASPESYVRLQGQQLSMRPIAGTLAKHPGLSAREIDRSLRSSVKENAEHIMLVDLCRNDIGRVCQPGSLGVPSLMALEEFPSLYHLVSTVTGTLRIDCDATDVLRATFPAGTMVGAPKIRAMEIIEQLEATPRGPYAGAIGLVGLDGSMNMALCIRMASHRDGEYRLRASAGVVFDSDPEREWEETITKMRSVYRALTGEELKA